MNNKAAFFDLDGTITCYKTENLLAKEMYRARLLSLGEVARILIAYLKYDLHLERDYNATKRKIIKTVLGGKDFGRINEVFETLFQHVLKDSIYPEMTKHIAFHQQQGHELYIVSAASSFIAKRFAQHLGIQQILSTELVLNDQEFTGDVHGIIHYSHTKSEAIQRIAEEQGIDLSQSYAYGDYYEDRFMLGVTGHPRAVNPDKRLRQFAIDNKWEIITTELHKQ